MARGGTAVIWSPASASSYRFRNRLARGEQAIRSLGFETRLLPSANGGSPTPYLHAEALANEVHEALRDNSVTALIATSGGWTSLGVVPHLDMDMLARYPKVFVGYSDLTVLLNVITAKSGLITFLGPMVLPEFGESGGPFPFTKESFLHAITAGEGAQWHLESSQEWTDERLGWEEADTRRREGTSHVDDLRILRRGGGRGRLWGGSIRSVGLLAGTPYWPCPDGPSVILLEDEGMSPDELFAQLSVLRLAGAFDACVAALIGRFSRPRSNSAGFSDLDVVLLHAIPERVAVVAGVDFGHTEPKHTLPIGAQAIVVAETDSPLITIRLEP